jgi:hypothetical protein
MALAQATGRSAAARLQRVPPLIWLYVCGLLILLIFLAAFTTRYPLIQFDALGDTSISQINALAPEGAAIYVLAFAALFAVYAFGYWIAVRRIPALLRDIQQTSDVKARKEGRSRYGSTLLFTVLLGLGFNVVLLPMYPVDATDVYDYIIRGRMVSVYGLNPLVQPPNVIEDDEFYLLAGWRNVPSAYGAAWEVIAAITTAIAGNDSKTNVVAFKIVSVIGYLITALFIALTLGRLAPQRVLIGLYLWMWNPLVIYMTGGRAHNDTLMTACILAAVYFMTRREFVAATVVTALGTAIKFFPIVIAPVIAVVAFRELSKIKFVRYVVLSGVLSAALVFAFYAPFWQGGAVFNIERRTRLFTSSIGTLARQTLAPILDGVPGTRSPNDTPDASNAVSRAGFLSFGVFIALQLAWLYFTPSTKDDPFAAIRTIMRIFLFYLLVSVLWFQPWYLLWVVSLAALLSDTPMRRLVLWFTYFAMWKEFLYYYVTLRYTGFAPLPWRDLIPFLVTIFTSWVYVGWIALAMWLRTGTRTAERAALGERLQTARDRANVSVETLADETGYPADHIRDFERGDRAVTLEQLDVLGARLGADLRG